jgi:hypothetical protein
MRHNVSTDETRSGIEPGTTGLQPVSRAIEKRPYTERDSDPRVGKGSSPGQIVLHDEGLMRFDSLMKVISYPCEMLWGPGTPPRASPAPMRQGASDRGNVRPRP